MKKVICLAALALSFSACQTSGDVTRGKDYVDPTDVRTEDEGPQRVDGQAVEELRRQNAVLQGELEAAKMAHSRDTEASSAKIKALEEEVQRYREAGAAAEAARNAKPKNAEELWKLGLKAVEGQQYLKSAEVFDEILNDYPRSAWVFYAQLGKAMSLYNAGEFKQAALVFNQIIDKYPKKRESSLAWFGQGSAFFKMGQKQDAKLFYTEVATRFPKSEEASLAKRIQFQKRPPPGDLFVAFPGWAKYAPQAP